MKIFRKSICVISIIAILAGCLAIAASAADNSPVARFYLCSNWRKVYTNPHAFIYVENLSGHDIKVGAYTCHKGEGVSVGTSGLAQFNGFGVYYNLESYNGNIRGLDNCVYLVRNLNQSELDSMSDYIISANYWVPVAYNCVTFAVKAWNKAGGEHITPLDVPPHILRLQIERRDHGEDDLKMYFPDSSRVYKQRGNGANAILEPVRNSALNCNIG